MIEVSQDVCPWCDRLVKLVPPVQVDPADPRDFVACRGCGFCFNLATGEKIESDTPRPKGMGHWGWIDEPPTETTQTPEQLLAIGGDIHGTPWAGPQ